MGENMSKRSKSLPTGRGIPNLAMALLMVLLFPLSAIASEPGRQDDSRAGDLSFEHRFVKAVEDGKGNTTLTILMEVNNKSSDKFELARLLVVSGEQLEIPDHPRFATPLWIGSLAPGVRSYTWHIKLPTSDGIESILKGPLHIKVEADAGSGKFYYDTVSEYKPDRPG